VPNTIRHKRSATASAAPAAASLVAGELAVNTADGRVYTKQDSGTVVDIAQAILATGQTIVAAAGSATASSVAFTGDSNTGTYSPGADQWAVTTGGVQRIYVGATGSVGIGTAAPNNLLVVSAADTTNSLTNAVAAITLVCANSGAFGRTTNLNFNQGDSNAGQRLATIAGVYTTFNTSVGGALAFCTADGTGAVPERMRLTANGNLGIGTTAPASALDVNGVVTTALGSATAPAQTFTGDTNTGTYSPGADQWAVTTAGGQRLHINSTGDVGISTTAGPTVRLNCYQTATNQNGYVTHQVFADPVSTSNGAYAHFGAYYILRTDVLAGITDTGAKRGIFASTIRNNKATNNTDAGTLTFLRGAEFQYGHGVQNTAIAPTTTAVTGVFLSPLAGYGTITDMYDLYIAGPAHNLGTVGNHYAIYQAGTASRSFFAGNVGIGANRTSPASALDVNGAVTHALGSASAPAVTFTGDSNTGIFSPGADQLNLVTGGVSRITVAANGLVTTTSDLTCNGTLRALVGLQSSGGRSLFRAVNEPYAVGSAYSATSGAVYFGAANESATPDAQISSAGGGALMYLQNGGNVGIGTTSPSQRLDVNGSVRVAGNISRTGASAATDLGLYSETPSNWIRLACNAGDIRFFVDAAAGNQFQGGTAAAILNSAGNFGIGTTTPGSKLEVAGSATITGVVTVSAGSAAAPAIVPTGDTNTGRFHPAADTIAWATNGTERMRVASDGAVSIAGEFKPTHYTESVVAIGNSGTTRTLALTSGTVQTCTLTGNCTFTMPTATAGKSFVMLLRTGTGSFTATFTGVKWPGNVAPTITATAAKLEVISFIADGTNWYGNISQNYTP